MNGEASNQVKDGANDKVSPEMDLLLCNMHLELSVIFSKRYTDSDNVTRGQRPKVSSLSHSPL